MSIRQNERLTSSLSSSFVDAAANRYMFVDSRHRSGAGHHYEVQTILTKHSDPAAWRGSQISK